MKLMKETTVRRNTLGPPVGGATPSHTATFSLAYRLYGLVFNPITGTLKPHSNGPLYSNTMIGTLAVDGWASCYIWYNKEVPGRVAAPPRPLLAVPNVTAHPSTASVTNSMWH